MTIVTYLTAVIFAATLTSSSIVKPPTNDGNFELLILHNNDMHARFEQTSQLSGTCTVADRDAGKCYGGFPRVAHVVKEARKAAASGEGPPVLYLNAGDTYTGTTWFTLYKWKIAAEFLNALQPDAVSLGNHEFDNGVSGLIPFIANLSCPVLACNLILNKEPALKAEKNLLNSTIFNINGTKIGVIGYLTPETKVLAVRNKVEYVEEVVAIREEIVRLKNQGINIFIALGHSGYLKDLEIAKKVEDIDIVIGGHTNTFLWNGTSPDAEKPEGFYPTLVKKESGKFGLVLQAYAYTKYIGKLSVVFDKNGDITSFFGNPILLDNTVPQDPTVLEIVNRYSGEVNEVSNLVVGNSSVFLEGKTCQKEECNMGNLITDAIIYKYALDYKGIGWTDAPIAIIQGGGVRSSVSHPNLPFEITKGDLLTVMPFEGNIVKVKINGTRILQMLEHSVERYNNIIRHGEFLQFSGLKVEYDFQKRPGMRVKSAYARCGKCQIPIYTAVNESVEYNILMSTFLSMGGDGFLMFTDLPATTLPYNELTSTIDYVQKYSPIYPAVEGRIIIHNLDKLKTNSAESYNISLRLFTLLSLTVLVLV